MFDWSWFSFLCGLGTGILGLLGLGLFLIRDWNLFPA